jgi:hypothetical protein
MHVCWPETVIVQDKVNATQSQEGTERKQKTKVVVKEIQVPEQLVGTAMRSAEWDDAIELVSKCVSLLAIPTFSLAQV